MRCSSALRFSGGCDATSSTSQVRSSHKLPKRAHEAGPPHMSLKLANGDCTFIAHLSAADAKSIIRLLLHGQTQDECSQNTIRSETFAFPCSRESTSIYVIRLLEDYELHEHPSQYNARDRPNHSHCNALLSSNPQKKSSPPVFIIPTSICFIIPVMGDPSSKPSTRYPSPWTSC